MSYEEMNRRELMEEIAALEQRLAEAEKWADVWIKRSKEDIYYTYTVPNVNFPYLKGILQGALPVSAK